MKIIQYTAITPHIPQPIKTGSLSECGLKRYIATAAKAGRAFAARSQGNDYACFILDNRLEDTEREQLGYATYMISRAKQAGKTPQEIWSAIQSSFGARHDKPMELFDMDNVRLGILAFGAGICSEDSQVASSITEYINGIVNGRVFAASRVPG